MHIFVNMYNTLFYIVFLLVIFSTLFHDNTSFFYYLAIIFATFNIIINKKLNSQIVKYYIITILFLLTSVFSPFFDSKIFINTIGFLSLSVFLSNFIISANDSYKTVDNLIKIISITVVVCILFTIGFTNGLYYLSQFDHNSFYLRMYNLTGLNKQHFAQIAIFPILYLWYNKSSKKLISWSLLIVLVYVTIGSRSVFFGLTSLTLITLFRGVYKYMIAYSILVVHIIFIIFILNYDSLDIIFQLDPRWGMQAVSVFTSQKYLFGIGYGGWNEFAISNLNELLKYLKYFPIWLGYSSDLYIPTTLESSLFQLNAELGFLSTITLYFFFIYIFTKNISSKDNNLKFHSTYNLILLFASFYQDILFQPIWYISYSIMLGFYIKHK